MQYMGDPFKKKKPQQMVAREVKCIPRIFFTHNALFCFSDKLVPRGCQNVRIFSAKQYILEWREVQLGNGRGLIITRNDQNHTQTSFRYCSSTIVYEQ